MTYIPQEYIKKYQERIDFYEATDPIRYDREIKDLKLSIEACKHDI